MAPKKRPAAAVSKPAAKKSKASEPAAMQAQSEPKAAVVLEAGDDAFDVRKHLFKAGGLMPKEEYDGPHVFKLTAQGVGKFEGAAPVDLKYFAIRGLGQLPQLCLEVAGYPYRYHVMTSPHFRDNVKSTLVFGRLPTMTTVEGREIAQSKAVLRYAAKVSGLAGDSDAETARCDMMHEMLISEASVDAVDKLDVEAAKTAELGDVKSIGRMASMDLDENVKTLNSLKFWNECLQKSSSGWLLGSLGDEGSTDLSFVDLALYWKLRSHADKVAACGFESLAAFIKKVDALEGVQRLFTSGRLMPNMAEGYKYKADDLVPAPEEV